MCIHTVKSYQLRPLGQILFQCGDRNELLLNVFRDWHSECEAHDASCQKQHRDHEQYKFGLPSAGFPDE